MNVKTNMRRILEVISKPRLRRASHALGGQASDYAQEQKDLTTDYADITDNKKANLLSAL